MAGITENYGLTIQGLHEKYDVEVLNRNFRKIDKNMKDIETEKLNPEDAIPKKSYCTGICGECIYDVDEPIDISEVLDFFIKENEMRWVTFSCDPVVVTGLPISSGKVRITVHGTSAKDYIESDNNEATMQVDSDTDSAESDSNTESSENLIKESNFIIICDNLESPFDQYVTLYNIDTGIEPNWIKIFTTADIRLTAESNDNNPVASKVTHELDNRLAKLENVAPLVSTELTEKLIITNSVKGRIMAPRIIGNMKIEGESNFNNIAVVKMASNPFTIRNYGKNFFPYIEISNINGVQIHQEADGIYLEGISNAPVEFELTEMNLLLEGEEYYLKADNLENIQEITLSLVDIDDNYIDFLTITPDNLEVHGVAENLDSIKHLSFQIIIGSNVDINTHIRVAITRGIPSEKDMYPTSKVYNIQTAYPLVSIPITNYNVKPDLEELGKRYISNSIRNTVYLSYFLQRVGYEMLDRDMWDIYQKDVCWTENYAIFQNVLSKEGVNDEVYITCYSPQFKPISMSEMINGNSIELIGQECISVLGSTVLIAINKERFESDITPEELDKILLNPVEVFYQLKNEEKITLDENIELETHDGDTYVVIDDNPYVLIDAAYGNNQSGQDIITSIARMVGE